MRGLTRALLVASIAWVALSGWVIEPRKAAKNNPPAPPAAQANQPVSPPPPAKTYKVVWEKAAGAETADPRFENPPTKGEFTLERFKREGGELEALQRFHRGPVEFICQWHGAADKANPNRYQVHLAESEVASGKIAGEGEANLTFTSDLRATGSFLDDYGKPLSVFTLTAK